MQSQFRCYILLLGFTCLLGCHSPVEAQGVQWNFNTPGNTEGWSALHSMSPLTVSSGVLRSTVTGHDPYFGSPAFSINAAESPFVVIRMRLSQVGQCQIFWTTAAEPQMSESKSDVFSVHRANSFHNYILDLREHNAWNGTITRLRIDPPNEAQDAVVEVDYVRIVPFNQVPPVLHIQEFRDTEQVIQYLGDRIDVTAIVKNQGGEPLNNLNFTLDVPPGFSVIDGNQQQSLTQLAGGTTHTLAWTLEATAPGAGALVFTANAVEDGPETVISRLYSTVPFLIDSWRPSAASVYETDTALYLGNPKIRAVFLKSPVGYGTTRFEVWADNTWRTMALMPAFSNLAVDTNNETHRNILFASDVALMEGDPVSLIFSGTHHGTSGVDWEVSFQFSIEDNADSFDVQYTASPQAHQSIRAFEGPILYVGASSFGDARNVGIFPGLEWVVDDEISSSTLDVTTDEHVRYVPHTTKITIPAMSLHWEQSAIGLLWHPEIPWHEDSTRPSAVYAVPDHFGGKAASIMGLFVPSVPENVSANAREAHTPYAIAAGQTLRLECKVAMQFPVDDPVVMQEYWLEAYGLPEPLPNPRGSLLEEMEFSLEAYMTSLWVPEERHWEAYLEGGEIFDQQFQPASILHYLELGARHTQNPAQAQRFRERIAEALAAGAGTIDMRYPFYMGDPAQAMEAHVGHISNLIAQQWEDGSWRFDATRELSLKPGEYAEILGPHEAAELGLSANNAMQLAHFARLTGDLYVTERAMLALDFMKQFEVPRAAQTWEIAVHTPDILAAGFASLAFLEGYLLTGREDYRAESVRWARATLPFIYTWGETEYDWMLYGSIPVFGATFYVGSWFGRIVQWNGLDVAYALLRLAPYDNTLDWETIGRGLLVSGFYQQETDPEWIGTYRDYFVTMNGSRGGPLINPGLYMPPLYLLLGDDPMAETISIYHGQQTMRVSSAATLVAVDNDNTDGSFSFTTAYLPNESTATLVAGINRPESIYLNGMVLPEVVNLAEVESGWRYRPGSALLSIKLMHGASPAMVVVEGALPHQVELFPDARSEIRFCFTQDARFEGWFPQNHLSHATVEDGIFSMHSTGSDPYMTRGNLVIPADSVDTIAVHMRTSAGTVAEFFWGTEESPGFHADRRIGFPIQSNGNFNTYYIDVGAHEDWAGQNIAAIRLDPVTVSNADIEIDFIIGGLSGELDLVCPEPGQYHTADINMNYIIELGELLRVIQFYNEKAYHCLGLSEDGYAPGEGSHNCVPHSSDYAPQNWYINLSEVLRLVQLQNAGAYHACENSEDGFCLGSF